MFGSGPARPLGAEEFRGAMNRPTAHMAIAPNCRAAVAAKAAAVVALADDAAALAAGPAPPDMISAL